MDYKYVFALIMASSFAWGDTGFNPPSVLVSTDSAKAVTKGIQKIIFSTGTTVSISGSTAKISVGTGSGNYIQNTLSPTTGTQAFSVQTGSATTSFTTPKVIFSGRINQLQEENGSSLLGTQGSFNTYLGEGSVTSTGGGFNTCVGTQCMTPFNGGLFDACVGTFCMATGAGVAGQQNGCIGYACMFNMTGGSYNNCNGGSCMGNSTNPNNNVCNGIACLRDNANDYNTCDGEGCFEFNTSGTHISALGALSGTNFIVANSTNQLTQSDMNYFGYGTTPGDPNTTRSVVIGNLGIVTSSDTVAFRASNLALVQSTAPVITSCGTSPSVIGTNSAFTITVGATTTGCTATFSQPFAGPLTCVISERTPSLVNALTYVPTANGIVFSQTAMGGSIIDAICIGGK